MIARVLVLLAATVLAVMSPITAAVAHAAAPGGQGAAARAGTKNDLTKQFAQSAVDTVMKHMTVLEDTKLVDANALPDPALPQTTDQAQGGSPADPGSATPTTAQVVQQSSPTTTVV